MATIPSRAALGLLVFAVPCMAAPLKGSALAKLSDGVAPVNEPCYVHDAACAGYPVCCVTLGTCISQHSGTVSSNTAYYEGGCQSLDSSKKDWSKSPGCTQQGECLVQHLEVCKGGTTKAGYMAEVPSATLDRLMAGSCGADCPNSNYGHGSYGSNNGDPTNETVSTTTKTTTTTSITVVTKSISLVVSDVAAAAQTVNMELLMRRAFAAMAGLLTDYSMVTVQLPALAAKMAVTYQIEVSSAHSATAEEVESTLDAMSSAQVNGALAMRIGTCSYTVTVEQPPDMSNTDAAGASRALLALVGIVFAAVWA